MVFDVIGDTINHQHINHNIIERATTYKQPNNNNKFLGLLQYYVLKEHVALKM